MERAQFIVVVVVYAVWAGGLSKEGARSEPWPQIDVMVLRTANASEGQAQVHFTNEHIAAVEQREFI